LLLYKIASLHRPAVLVYPAKHLSSTLPGTHPDNTLQTKRSFPEEIQLKYSAFASAKA
jgi:hypothetical protein